MAQSRADKTHVLFGILSAWVIGVAYIGSAYLLLGQSPISNNLSSDKSFIITILLASLPLIIGISLAAKTRHLISNIDGSIPDPGSALDIILRFVTNTTEQTLLFVMACYCLKIAAPDFSTKMLPILGSWFVLARLIFYIGYKINPLARSVGFAATFHMTLATYIYVIIKLI